MEAAAAASLLSYPAAAAWCAKVSPIRRKAQDRGGVHSAYSEIGHTSKLSLIQLPKHSIRLALIAATLWVSGQWETCDGKRCLLQAVSFVRRQIGSRADRAPAYLARAIRDNDYIRLQDRIIAYNDARGRTYPEIAALIHAAKALAEADARSEPDRAEGL
jgi:hypothetical protein